jgi:hypothetical protein
MEGQAIWSADSGNACLQGRRWWRMAEPCLLMALFLSAGMALPLAFPCTPSQCVIAQGASKPVCPAGTPAHVQCAPQPSLCRLPNARSCAAVEGMPHPLIGIACNLHDIPMVHAALLQRRQVSMMSIRS